MRYLKMTLPALILIVVLVVALVIYPDMAKSYQERESAAAAEQQSEEQNAEAGSQPNEEVSAAAESQLSEDASAADEEQTSAESSAEEESMSENEQTSDVNAADEQSEAVSQDSAASDVSEETSAAAESVPKNTAPDFEVRDAYGMNGRLSNHFGKPIVVNFWATWCPFCVQELPLFDKYAKDHSGDIDFMIVDLVDGYRETIEKAKKYVADYGYSFPVYFDTTGGSTYAYGITGIPVTLFIDGDGNLMTQHVGAIDEDTLVRNIQALQDDPQQ